jgi:parvulin-like peptidyl-prolyl isomerase
LFKWHQEPFFHFIILGAILFVITTKDTPKDLEEKSKTITVKQEDLSKVLNYWSRDHNRTPSDEELDKLLKDYMQDEILYREALNRNLDKDDGRIKKLLVDKLKYTISDSLNINEVSTAVLKEYFNKHKEMFTDASLTSLTFGHIYINPKKHKDIDILSKKLFQEIISLPYSKELSKRGDKFYAGNYFNGLNKQELSKYFSRSFVNKLMKLPKGKWSLLKSGYGVHLIYIVDIAKKEVTFDNVKKSVKDRYLIEQNRNAYKKFYDEIKKEYSFDIEDNRTKNGSI